MCWYQRYRGVSTYDLLSGGQSLSVIIDAEAGICFCRTVGMEGFTSGRHCGLVVSAPAWDGTGCEFVFLTVSNI